jgi:hypothetical protein
MSEEVTPDNLEPGINYHVTKYADTDKQQIVHEYDAQFSERIIYIENIIGPTGKKGKRGIIGKKPNKFLDTFLFYCDADKQPNGSCPDGDFITIKYRTALSYYTFIELTDAPILAGGRRHKKSRNKKSSRRRKCSRRRRC